MVREGDTRRKEESDMRMIPTTAQAWLAAGQGLIFVGAAVAVPEMKRFRC